MVRNPGRLAGELEDIANAREAKKTRMKNDISPELHFLRFTVPDPLHGEKVFEVHITIGFYRTTATLCVERSGKMIPIAQDSVEDWNNASTILGRDSPRKRVSLKDLSVCHGMGRD